MKYIIFWVVLFSFVSFHINAQEKEVSPSSLQTIKKEHPDSVKCPRCGEVNPWERKYCGRCGLLLEEAKREAMKSFKKRFMVKVSSPQKPSQTKLKKVSTLAKKDEGKLTKKKFLGPTRLFLAPTCDIIDPYVIGLIGGGTLNMVREKEGYQPFSPLFLFNFGLGGIGELEVNSIGTLTNIGRGVLNVPATSVKVRLWKEFGFVPSFGFLFKTWPFYSEQWQRVEVSKDTAVYYRYLYRAGTIYGIFQKKLGDLDLVLGGKVIDNRYKIVREDKDEKEIDEKQKITYSGMGGLLYSVNNSTILMIEYQDLSLYHFSPEKMEIKPRHTVMIGVRFFFIPEISIDAAGVVTSQEFKGIADIIIHTNINISFHALDAWRLFSRTCLGG